MATVLIVVAVAPEGPTLFLVPAGEQGITVVDDPPFTHNYPHGHPTLRFDVEVGPDARLGPPGGADALQRAWFSEERLGIAARGIGAMERLLEETVAWCTGRRQGGARLWDHQGVAFPLADSAADAAAGRLLVLETARLADAGADPKVVHAKASLAKLFVSEAAGRCADRAVQAFGGRGYRRDNVAERFWRELRVDRHLGGHQRDPAADRGPRAGAQGRPGGPALAVDLTALLHPRSIAVVGATERPGAYGDATLRNLAALGFPGPVWAVHPTRREVHGRPCVPALEDLPEPVDAVAVAIPAPGVPAVVRAARARGCGAAVVFAAGFAESGGRALQDELRAAAGDMPLLGPNCDGLVAFHARAALWGDALRPRPAGRVALISQSGNVAVNALSVDRGLRFHTVASVGNQALIAAADLLAALVEEPEVGSVALFLESDGDGAALATALARAAERGIGVAVLKVGATAAGATAAAAHTGAVAGDQRVFRALVEEAGGAWAEDVHDLLELAKALAVPGARIGRAGRRGAADGRRPRAAGPSAARRAAPAAHPATRPRAAAPGSVSSPAPAATRASPPTPRAGSGCGFPCSGRRPRPRSPPCCRGRRRSPTRSTTRRSCGASASASRDWSAPSGAIPASTSCCCSTTSRATSSPRCGRAGTRSGMGSPTGPPASGRRRSSPPPCPSCCPTPWPRTSSRAASPRSPVSAPRSPAPPRCNGRRATRSGCGRSRRPPPAARADGTGPWLDEAAAKALVRAQGVPVTAGAVVTEPEAAVAAADALRGPVAVKSNGPGLRHKSEAGAVVLGVSGADAVRAAYARVAAAGGEPVIVEAMAPEGVEVLVAARRDAVVPVLVVGLGGVWTELLDDVAIVPLPASPERVEAALRSLRGAGRLLGARGRPPVDLAALARLAAAAGDVLLSEPLTLLELNPVIAGPAGAVAVDAVARR